MLCTERHVRKGTELAQDACEINREIYLDKYGIKRTRKSYSANVCHSSPYIHSHVKMKSHYASVNFFFTHTVYHEAH